MKLRRRAEFTRVYDRGTRYRGRLMTCFALPNEVGSPRLGIAASQKIGNAVVRNRAKRLVRELFRGRKPLTGIDIVVIPRREMVDAPWRNIEADYRAALERFENRGRESFFFWKASCLLKKDSRPLFLSAWHLRLFEATNSLFDHCLRARVGICRPARSMRPKRLSLTARSGVDGWASSACSAATLSVARVWIRSLS